MSPATIQQAQPQAPRSGMMQEYKDKMEEINRLHSSNALLDGSSSSNDNDSFSKQITDSNTSSIVGSNHNSVKFSPQQVLPQTFSESLEDSNDEIEREFGNQSKQEDYKEFVAETYSPIVNSRIEAILVYIWNRTQRDTKTFIDTVFNALEKPVEKPRNFELKFNPQYSLEGNLYELNRIYNKDRDVLSAKCILDKEEFDFKSEILLEQIPKYTIKAIKKYFDRRDYFKDYSSLISDKIGGLEKSNQGRLF